MNTAPNINRGSRGLPRGRGRGRGRGGRGGFNDRDSYGDRPTLHPVPTIQQVIIGAPVSIVLKIDQPTGHEIQGIVAELLTKGNHPRGIKVRLQDGRVGRVQRMASVEAATAASADLSGLGRNQNLGSFVDQSQSGMRVAERPVGNPKPAQYTDYRYDCGEAPDRPELSLTDYIITKSKGKKGKKKGQSLGETEETNRGEPVDGPHAEASVSICPVCGDFEGDEAAVAHHVETHFD